MSEPALTAEEWMMAHTAGVQIASRIFARLQNEGVELRDKQFGAEPVDWSAWFGPGQRLRFAAMLLIDSAAGFTWEDVDLIRRAAGFKPHDGVWLGTDPDHPLISVADRIAALLPPREG